MSVGLTVGVAVGLGLPTCVWTLALAEDLGTRLLPAFSSPTGMPYLYVNLKTGKTSGTRSNPLPLCPARNHSGPNAGSTM